jgi:hypothetical protein
MKNIYVGLLSRLSRLREILCSSLKTVSLDKKALLLMVLLHLSSLSFSQTPDSTTEIRHFSSAVSITNNGISLVPTFSLGKPAAIFNLSVGTRKITAVASEAMGIAPGKIMVQMGSTTLPPGPTQGGSNVTSTVGSAVHEVCVALKEQIAALASKEGSVFHTAKVHDEKLRTLSFPTVAFP